MAPVNNDLTRLCFEHRGETVDKREQYLAIYARELKIVDPFVGIIALPLAKIEPLLFGDEQKRHIDAMMVDHLKVLEERRDGPRR